MKPLRAAIYARRSTDEHQVESLATQLDNARRYAVAKGMVVEPAHVFTDAASRAEFAPKRRPGFAALRDAAVEGNFDVIITRDDSRLGVFYSTGEEMMLRGGARLLMPHMARLARNASFLGFRLRIAAVESTRVR